MQQQTKRMFKGNEARDQSISEDDEGRESVERITSGIYIYGIIQTGDRQEFGRIGIGDSASEVRTIGFKDLAAVVSDSPLMVYNTLAKEKIVKDLVTHQFVIETVMRSFTIIPAKLGTMVKTEGEALQFLEKGFVLLTEELNKMRGKIELDVVANWELPKILAVCR